MGMYDNIICEYPIDAEVQNEVFQTKSLDCRLNEYKIDKDGQLWKNDKIFYDEPDDWVEIKSTYYINFYTSIGNRNNTWKWYEYHTYFKKGKLIDIEKIDKN